ncbi:NAD(P)/FAD-dependent oxidoreductase [Neoroseomonas lacus]|uniref:FAD-dependent oxidoreductase n=1 Tax=Neoroseomonas lacus TaxID=287609 RepID=A0A917NPX1_9PROT|nr:FAD-dependent oxidoreductase [Neoroseomonas lacus]GGJ17083.1 FAD-dependent oxidoreductase [Neoroseomonas lacus]
MTVRAPRRQGRILVAGGGIAGLCTAWALTRRGFAVTVIEQGDLPNPLGSSFDEHRIIRHAYGEMRGYARLIPQAFAAWDELWSDLGAVHLEPTPSIHLLSSGQESWIEAVAATQAEAGLALREIDPATARRSFPMLRVEAFARILEAQGSGILFASRIVEDLVRWLARHGAQLLSRTRVTAIDPVRGTVTADARDYEADLVVVAAGAWVGRLLPAYDRAAVPSRQAVIYLEPPATMAAAWAVAPVIISRGANGAYILPPRQGTRLKIGDHSFSLTGDPDAPRDVRTEDVARLHSAIAGNLRDAESYRITDCRACYYTVTADERFIVEPLAECGWIISACSGHGFKFGALMGRAVAQAIAGERSAESVPSWAGGGAPANRCAVITENVQGAAVPAAVPPAA